ncbi:MAG: FG-GAP-like repeat-containing protein [Planctomycetota bacterium]
MHRHRQRYRCRYWHALLGGSVIGAWGLVTAPALAGDDWVTYVNETSVRLNVSASLGSADPEEKEYAWGDVDHDAPDFDIDLIVVRKQPLTTAGGRRNVLLLNDDGVLTDHTEQYIPGFLDATNDRDVKLVDVDKDGWLDIVTAAACNSGICGMASESRLYMNLGDDGVGNWLGFDDGVVLFTGNNFCAVAEGDVTGDTYDDLYFVSYNDSTEDQLLINGGPANPGGFTLENSRLSFSMRSSGFGTNAVIADMNGDEWNDIVKSENGPVEIFNNAGGGIFDMLDSTYFGAAYHVGVGDMNDDGKMDLVVADDGVDRVLLNSGNGVNGMADFNSYLLPNSTQGFGSNTYIVDLEGNGWNDILIADVDVDLAGCDRTADILRSNGNPPVVSFSADAGNTPSSLLQGVHDFAIFDINGDTFLDLVIGRCSGTQVWINAPPIALTFSFPGGLPEILTPGETTEIQIQLDAIGGTIEPGSPTLHLSVNGGAYTTSPLASLGGNLYAATLPAGTCTDRFEYYFSAQLSGGLTFFEPAAAPLDTYRSIAAWDLFIALSESFEGDVSGWTIDNDPSLVTGAWEQANPNATFFGLNLLAPEDDATIGGTQAFVTQNGPPGSGFDEFDVDGGPTMLISPPINLENSDAFITYAVWFRSFTGVHDRITVDVSNNGGSSWTITDSMSDTAGAWQPSGFLVSDYVTPTADVVVRFVTKDNPDDSYTEAGVDEFMVEQVDCLEGCLWDLDGSGDVGVTDFLILLGAWGPNPGHPADFDGDDEVGVTDFLVLLGSWGPCP